MTDRHSVWKTSCACLILLCVCRTSWGQESKFAQMDILSRSILLPIAEEFATAQEVGLDGERVEFRNRQGNLLSGWFIPGDNSKTILVCPGNAGNVAVYFPYADVLVRGGFNVLIFNYQGFGESEGIPNILSLPGDVECAYEFLRDKKNVKPDDLGVFGVSLGSTLSFYLAARNPVSALAVEDTFIPGAMLDRYIQKARSGMLFELAANAIRNTALPAVDPMQNVKKVKCPILFLHGANDNFLPPVSSFQVASQANVPTRSWIMQGVGHAPESLEVNDLEYAHQLQKYFTEILVNNSDFSNDPSFTFDVQESPESGAEPETQAKYITKLLVKTEEESPVEICLMDDQSHSLVERRICELQREFEIVTAFRPSYVSVIECRHAVKAESSWEPALSQLSSDRKTYQKIASESTKKIIELYRTKRDKGETVQPLERWGILKPMLPEPQKVHAHIRPYYAQLIARRLVNIRDIDQKEMIPHWETMLAFFPENPKRHYQLGDANFQLGFANPVVSIVLRDWIVHELDSANVEKAQTLMQRYIELSSRGGEHLQAIGVDKIQSSEQFLSVIRNPEKN